jgi:YD repeat-containing protein
MEGRSENSPLIEPGVCPAQRNDLLPAGKVGNNLLVVSGQDRVNALFPWPPREKPLVSGNVYVPKTKEFFSYDLDGNLTNDGRWAYSWDAENRLVRVVANTSIGATNRIDFGYDWKSRREQAGVEQ